MTEIGKFGKEIGALHPRDLRKTDPIPERPTPAKTTQKKRPRNYGYSYEYRSFFNSAIFGVIRSDKWRAETVWYATRAGRDMALKHQIHDDECFSNRFTNAPPRYRNFKKVER